ncbi:MAG: ABC transporter permease, partial [Dehalococcoidia bacterium]|nr:ABC transporter permease [Dehalococcoidia bacterium]
MSLKRVGILLGKEFFHGPRGFILIWAIAAPLLISLVVSLAFGTFFSETPRIGFVDEGSSQLVALSQQLDSVVTKDYGTVSGMKQAVESGAVDMGIVLPAGFDDAVVQGEAAEITAYVWGESLAKNRTILSVTLADLIRELAGQEVSVEIETVALGDEVSVPWSDRLLPFIVLMAVLMGGIMLPATSIISEKQNRTLQAVVVTPTTLADVFVAKALLGITLSLCMGILMLVINQAFGTQPLLLVLVLVLGSIMHAEIGLVLASVLKDTTSLFAVLKFFGILLYAPVLIYLFPQIPQWIGRIFPT